MTAQIIDGAAIAADFRADVAARVGKLHKAGVIPGLAAVLVGDDAGSLSYVSAKAKACEEAGIFSETFRIAETVSQDELLRTIRKLNEDERFHAILPQLP